MFKFAWGKQWKCKVTWILKEEKEFSRLKRWPGRAFQTAVLQAIKSNQITFSQQELLVQIYPQNDT